MNRYNVFADLRVRIQTERYGIQDHVMSARCCVLAADPDDSCVRCQELCIEDWTLDKEYVGVLDKVYSVWEITEMYEVVEVRDCYSDEEAWDDYIDTLEQIHMAQYQNIKLRRKL